MKIAKTGQTIIEYAILIFVAVAAMMAMTVYVKRAIQGNWRTNADSLSAQYDAKHTTSSITTSRTGLQYTETDSVIDGDVMRTTSKTTVVDETIDRTGSEQIEAMGELWD
jgi:Flp pilus assembly pilin Flp